MKKILVINPNSSKQMTNDIKDTIKNSVDSLYDIEIINMPKAPTVLESYADYTAASNEVICYLQNSNQKDYAGVLLACYGDPGLHAIKERCEVPMIGIAEASISMALLLGYQFSIIAASHKAKYMMKQLVDMYGLTSRLASIESLEMPIEAFMTDKERLNKTFKQCVEQAKGKGSEVIIYGCAGMTMLCAKTLSRECSIPVIDPLIVSIHTLVALIESNCYISNVGCYA